VKIGDSVGWGLVMGLGESYRGGMGGGGGVCGGGGVWFVLGGFVFGE